jgi:hypothetical protein
MILYAFKKDRQYGDIELRTVFTGYSVGILMENEDGFSVILFDDRVEDALEEERNQN